MSSGLVTFATAIGGALYGSPGSRFASFLGGRNENPADNIRMNVSLDEDDLRRLLGKIRILSYPSLARFKHIEEALDASGRLMLLFLTSSPTDGHWVTLFKSETQPHTLEWYDSYGLQPDAEKKWLSHSKLMQLHESKPLLTNLLKDAEQRGWRITYNHHHLQGSGHTINTCGRHCVVRLQHKDLSLPQYLSLIASSGLTPDQFVLRETQTQLHK